jgi:hypothetical protein
LSKENWKTKTIKSSAEQVTRDRFSAQSQNEARWTVRCPKGSAPSAHRCGKDGLLFDESGPIRPFSPTFGGAKPLHDLSGPFLRNGSEFVGFESLDGLPTSVICRALLCKTTQAGVTPARHSILCTA